jgi:hypothetical protein
MPDRLIPLIEATNAGWDALLAAIIATPMIPGVNDAGKAAALVFAAVVSIFGAGAGSALYLSTQRDLPTRLDAVERSLYDVQAEVREASAFACEVREILRDGNPLLCYRAEM